MLVSHKHRFIYLKTVKTAGTSIEAYFEPYCRPETSRQISHHCDQHESAAGIVGYRGPQRKGKKWYNHMPALEIKNKVGEQTWDSYFKFCAVRNPWQKTISAFAFHRYLNRITPKPSLMDQMRHPFHTREQLGFLRWLADCRPPVDKAIYASNDELLVDGIIRYEHLKSDMEKICLHINVPWEPQNLVSYKNGIRSLRMTANSLIRTPADRLIRDYYRFEIDTFNYTDPDSKGESPIQLQL